MSTARRFEQKTTLKMPRKKRLSICKRPMSGLGPTTDRRSTLLIRIALLPLAAGLSLFGQSFGDELRRAESGEAKAMTAVAHRYENGIGCPRDAGQAILWYQRAVNRNEPGAM